MNSETRRKRCYVDIRVTDYLAQWAKHRFKADSVTGGIIVPVEFNLHHCVWHLLERRGRRRRCQEGEPNLRIHLGCHRGEDGGYGKDPAFWNFLSPGSAAAVGRELLLLFNYEFHGWMERHQGEAFVKDLVRCYAKWYYLDIDCDETLMKNWQRYCRAKESLLKPDGA